MRIKNFLLALTTHDDVDNSNLDVKSWHYFKVWVKLRDSLAVEFAELDKYNQCLILGTQFIRYGIRISIMVNRKKSIIWFSLSFLSLLAGGMIYILWRPYTLKMFDWFSTIGMDNIVVKFRCSLSTIKVFLPKWFIYSLPQGLWCLSGYFFIHALWMNLFSLEEQFWLALILCLGICIEAFQLFGFLPGIFDFVDVVWIVIPYLFAFALFSVFQYNPIRKRGRV